MNKITEEELKKLNHYNSNYNTLLTTIGALEIEKNKLFYEHQGLQEEFEKFSKTLSDKYGDGFIDLETGEIRPEEAK